MAEITETQRILMMLRRDPSVPMSTAKIVEEEIRRFTSSCSYEGMLQADQYYRNRSAVQQKHNEIANRSNTKIEHSILKKLIDQKVNYTL